MKKVFLLLSAIFLIICLFISCIPTTSPITSTNYAPTINSTPSTYVRVGEEYTYDVDATDLDGDTLTYFLTIKPTGMIINATTGLINWAPTVTGDYNVTVKVSDGELFTTQSFTVTVEETGTSLGQVQLSSPSNGATLPPGGITFSWISGSNATKYQFILYNSLGQVALDWIDSNILCTVDLAIEETITWKVRAGDNSGNWGAWSSIWSLTITVQNEVIAGVVTGIWAYALTSRLGGLKRWVELSWDSYSGAIGYNIYRSVNQGEYSMIYQETTELFHNDFDVFTGNSYAYYVTAYGSGWETAPSEIIIINTWLPCPSLISPENGVAINNPKPTFTWNPGGVSNFPYGPIYSGEICLFIHDNNWGICFPNMTTSTTPYDQDGNATPLVASHSYNWSVGVYGYDDSGELIAASWSEIWEFYYKEESEPTNQAPNITSTPITSATVDQVYTYDVNASDPNGDTLTYSLTTKPTGMTINSTTGLINWNPTSIGDYNVTVKVSDGELFTTQSFTVTVEETGTTTRIIRLSGDLSFGSVNVGSTSQRTLTIYNDGNSSLTVTSISYPAGFSGSWSGTISAGSSRNVTVTFAPTQAITYSGTLTVNSDKTSGTNTKSVSGTGTQTTTTRIIRLSGDLSFGSVNVGSTSQRTLTIYNDGNSTLTVTSISYPAGFSGSWSGTISAGSSRNVTVTFSPTQAITYSGTLTVNSDKTSGTNTKSVSGTGTQTTTTRIIRLSGDLSFGSVNVGSTSQRTLTIYNDGNSTLTVTSISYPAGFSGSWSGTISAGSSRNVTVTFSPTQAITYSGTLTVNSDKTSGTNTKSVSGTGTQTTTTIIVTSPNGGETWNVGGTRSITWTVSGDISHIDHFILGYGTNGSCNQYYIDTTSSASRSYSWIIPNTPSTQCKIGVWAMDASDNSLAFDGSDGLFTISQAITTRIIRLAGDLSFGSVNVGSTSQRTLTIYNDGNSSLTVTSISGYPTGFSGSWSGTISAGSSRNVTVTFSPTQAITYSGTLTVNSDKTSGTNTKSVSGTGTQTTTTRIIRLAGDLSFGSVNVGSTSQRTLTIYNDGNSSLTVTSISGYPTGFSGSWSGTISAGSSRNVTVTFSPTQAITYSGTLTVNSDKTSGTNTKSVSGTGTSTPTLIFEGTGSPYTCGGNCTGKSYFDGLNEISIYQGNVSNIVRISPTNGSLNGLEYVVVRGCKWLGSSFSSSTYEICNSLNTAFVNGYKVQISNNQIQISLSTNKNESFKAVPWNNVEVIVKTSQSGTELGKYTFSYNSGTQSIGGIFPRVESAYGQCVWWAIKRFWEVKGKEIWCCKFYPSWGMTIHADIDTTYVPTQYDVLICDGTYTHYAFIEDVQDIIRPSDGRVYKKVFISQYNVIQQKYSEVILYWWMERTFVLWTTAITGGEEVWITGTRYPWYLFNYYIR